MVGFLPYTPPHFPLSVVVITCLMLFGDGEGCCLYHTDFCSGYSIWPYVSIGGWNVSYFALAPSDLHRWVWRLALRCIRLVHLYSSIPLSRRRVFLCSFIFTAFLRESVRLESSIFRSILNESFSTEFRDCYVCFVSYKVFSMLEVCHSPKCLDSLIRKHCIEDNISMRAFLAFPSWFWFGSSDTE